MSQAAFVDTNIPIYAAGRPHPFQAPGAAILELIARNHHAFVTDAEVLQELLHRYRSLGIWAQGKQVFDRFAIVLGARVEPVYAHDVQDAAAVAERFPGLSARDLLHLAVMQRLGCEAIITADRDFDGIAGIERLDPLSFGKWRGRFERALGELTTAE